MRVLGTGSPRVVHRLVLREPREVDEAVRELLTVAFYHAAD